MTIKEKYNEMDRNPPPVGASPERRFFEFMKKPGELERIVNVSFVVVAMTRKEAQQLKEEAEIFQQENSPKQAKRFQALKEEFGKGFPDTDAWLEHYGEKPEDWIPHICSAQPENRIAALLEHVVITHYENIPVTFWPDVEDSDKGFFAEESQKQTAAWKKLPRGYVLVIDGVSLFHPNIRRTLQQVSHREKRVALLLFSPLKAGQHPVEKLIEEELESELQWAFGSFAYSFDRLCEVGVNHERGFQRWLLASVPDLVKHIQAQERHHENAFGGRNRGTYDVFSFGGGEQ